MEGLLGAKVGDVRTVTVSFPKVRCERFSLAGACVSASHALYVWDRT